MAPGIASGSDIGVGGAFLLKNKTEKPMEPLSRNTPPFPGPEGQRYGRHLRPPPQELVTQSCAAPHIGLPRTRLLTG